MLTEKGLQGYCVQFARDCGILVYKFSSPSQRGVPDLLLIYKGRTTFIELKSPKGTGRLSPLQKREIAKIQRAGANVYVVSSKEEVNEALAEILHPET